MREDSFATASQKSSVRSKMNQTRCFFSLAFQISFKDGRNMDKTLEHPLCNISLLFSAPFEPAQVMELKQKSSNSQRALQSELNTIKTAINGNHVDLAEFKRQGAVENSVLSQL